MKPIGPMPLDQIQFYRRAGISRQTPLRALTVVADNSRPPTAILL